MLIINLKLVISEYVLLMFRLRSTLSSKLWSYYSFIILIVEGSELELSQSLISKGSDFFDPPSR